MALNENNRIFWAVKAFGIAADGTSSFTEVHGLQSVGITTTFNLEQVFEIGQIEIYENVENIPDVEVTLEKFLDGYPLIYHLATPGAPNRTLTGSSGQRCIGAMSIFSDLQNSASGTPNTQVVISGLYVNSISYTFPVEGFCSESISLVGNNKVWKSSGFTFTGTIFDNEDDPLAVTSGLGGVQQRQNVLFNGNGGDFTLLPGGTNGVAGISSSGTNNLRSDGLCFTAHVQNISVSTDLGRDEIFELGTRGPCFRYVNFPVEVTTEVEILSIDGDQVSATEAGVLGGGANLADKTIKIVTEEGTKLDLGSSNKMANVSYGGADANGGNATDTYSFTTFNNLTITHPQDPG